MNELTCVINASQLTPVTIVLAGQYYAHDLLMTCALKKSFAKVNNRTKSPLNSVVASFCFLNKSNHCVN